MKGRKPRQERARGGPVESRRSGCKNAAGVQDGATQAVDQYREAVEWIEAELRRNGVVEFRRHEHMVQCMAGGELSALPDGTLDGFSVSSQSVRGRDLNLLQLVASMRRAASARGAKK
jgi:hypothetical protein